MSGAVYITSLGAFLPGEPIANAQMEDYLGRIGGRPSRARERILRQNGIRTRHYAIDTSQRSLFRNSEMAALAVRQALAHLGRLPEDCDFLAAATTQGDLAVPGFASMVHGELKGRAMELASLHGVCASGMMALKSAYLQVLADGKQLAVACASEFPSRLFKSSRYEHQGRVEGGGTLSFDAEFLRWMLSDGAGAAVLQQQPRSSGLSLKIEWIQLRSHAHQNEVCMYAGANKGPDGSLGPGWIDYPSFEDAARDGAINLKQDIRLLDRMVQLGVDGFFELVESGKVKPYELDWVVCHYSSQFFKGRIFELLKKGGLDMPPERWFSNLSEKGNVGSASTFVLLEELFHSGRLQPGQQVMTIIPESGRFISAYMLCTVVGSAALPARPVPPPLAPGAPELKVGNKPVQQQLVRQLTRTWIDFEQQLLQVPLIRKLEAGTFTLDDYKLLLVNLRQQVVEGARWIARAASGITVEAFPLRSLFIQHARDEHRDFQMLERNYVSVGGALSEIAGAAKNVGSEALSAWMFHRAGQENPFDLLGAMFIIEGLGTRLANRWGALIRDQLSLQDEQVSFLLYHGKNDETHFGKLEQALDSELLTEALAERIVKTAKVTARLYRLQLEELGEHLMAGLALYAVAFYFATGLAINLTYHRALSHRAVKLNKGLERLGVLLGLPAGPPVLWAGNHRQHHAFADRPGDPHSPVLGGFWHAHVGWYIGRSEPWLCALYALGGPLRVLVDGYRRPRHGLELQALAADVAADPLYAFLSRPGPYAAGCALHTALFFGAAALGWGWVGLAVLWLMLVLMHNLGDAVDSAAHLWGERPYASEHRATNHRLTGLLALGEGWHANHHEFPYSARHGLLPHQPDWTWGLIRLLQRLGLASEVRVPEPALVAARLAQSERPTDV